MFAETGGPFTDGKDIAEYTIGNCKDVVRIVEESPVTDALVLPAAILFNKAVLDVDPVEFDSGSNFEVAIVDADAVVTFWIDTEDVFGSTGI